MNEWISIKDGLPPDSRDVLGYSEENTDSRSNFYILSYFNGVWEVLNDTYPYSSDYIAFEPTHWMPLPKVPNEGE